MSTTPQARELFQRVRDRAEGTPYVVTETEAGFDVTLDVVDAQWFGLFDKAGLSKVCTHHVCVPAPGVYTIVDDLHEVEWVAGVPRIRFSASFTRGRVIERSTRQVWAFDERGRFGPQVDYSFSSEEGRGLITAAAQELHLTSRRGLEERIGIWFAIIGALGAVVTVVVLLVVALTVGFHSAP